MILLEIQSLQSLYFLLFSLYFAIYFGHYLRMNLADKMYLLLYWVTYSQLGAIFYIEINYVYSDQSIDPNQCELKLVGSGE